MNMCAVTHAYHVLKHNHVHVLHNHILSICFVRVANNSIDVVTAAILACQAMIYANVDAVILLTDISHYTSQCRMIDYGI